MIPCYASQLCVASDEFRSGDAFLQELCGERRPAKNAGKLRKERIRSEEFQPALAGGLDQALGRSAPEKR